MYVKAGFFTLRKFEMCTNPLGLFRSVMFVPSVSLKDWIGLSVEGQSNRKSVQSVCQQGFEIATLGHWHLGFKIMPEKNEH